MQMLRRAAALTALVALLGCATGPKEVSVTNPLGNPPGMVDRLVMFDAAETWEEGDFEDVALVADPPAHLVLTDDNDRHYPRRGIWTSAAVETDFDFTEFLPSWNVEAPEDTGARFEVRVRDARRGTWSPWLHIGYWGRVAHRPDRRVAFDGGVVNVDVLMLDRPADAFQIRTRMVAFGGDQSLTPRLRRIAACYSGVVAGEQRRAELLSPPRIEGDWICDLGVPHHGQGELGRPLSGQCCSPTSLTMVLQHWGDDSTLLENSEAVYDEEYGIFGNWGRNVARAGELGHDAWLTRLRNWDQVKALVAEGQPIVASVSIGEGEIAGVDYTGGHLVVIRGFTSDGDVIVNDPAYREKGEGSVWRADEMATVWFDHGGVGYIVRPLSEPSGGP
jgi:hypothetical protein